MSQEESESRHSTMTLDEARQEASNHPGEFAALDLMRTKVYAFARTMPQLENILTEQGVDPEEVVFSQVATPDMNLGSGLQVEE